MTLKKVLIIAFISISFPLIAQSSLNGYKYVIVPKNFDFLKGEDQYQLNSLTKFLFEREGFNTQFDSDIKAEDLVQNPCLGLISRVKDNSSMFATKLVVELTNCKNEVVLTSSEGRSKVKDFKKGFHQALRQAFKSVTDQNYNYSPIAISASNRGTVKKETSEEKNQVEPSVKAKIETIKKTENAKIETVKEAEEAKVETETVEKIQSPKENIPEKVIEPIKEKEEAVVMDKISSPLPKNLLYAQANTNGYQLVDSTPKVVYILLKSDRKDVYIISDKNGIIYKEGKKWIAAYYKDGNLVTEELQIKF